MTPLNHRRLTLFKANKRGFYALIIFALLFFVTLGAELIANDKPFYLRMEGKNYFPAFQTVTEKTLGGEFETLADFKDPFLIDLLKEKKAFALHAPIRHSASSSVKDPLTAFPSPPTWRLKIPPCGTSSYCEMGNWNWLGTDDQGRDVLARVIYGFRLSVLFGLALTLMSAIIGITAGAIQGWFGGWVDLIFQRVIEIWTSIPSLYLLLILSSLFKPSVFVLLFILLLFSWTHLVGLVRQEFLRARNFEYVRAAKALGVGNFAIMHRHLLPNAFVATLTMLPFVLSGSVMTLTALDFLGLGLPVGSPSLGELLQQGKANLNAPWLGISAFVTIALMLSLLIFIGEAVRDALDPKKVLT
jgi:microcin C transport system permease protein